MLTVKCQGCGAVYKLSEELYSRKAAGFGVVVTCRRCKTEIHVEAQGEAGNAKPAESNDPTTSAEPLAVNDSAPKADRAPEADVIETLVEPASAAVTTAGPNAASPSAPRATPKATARWPEAINAALVESPAVAAAAPPPPQAEETAPAPPKVEAAKRTESPSSPHAAPAPQLPRPAPRPGAPPGTKPLVKRDPVSGPFVALSPGLLGVGRPAAPPPSSPDSEAPIDSSDFIDERNARGSPKAPPVRPPPAKSEQKAPPKRAPEPALPLKFKEPPKPPKQKPRAPVRADDVSDDLLSADVGFEGTPAGGAGAPPTIQLETEAPRILAPDSSALAAPPTDTEERESPKGALPSPSTSDAKPRPSSAGKPSRVVPIVLVSLGAAAAFGLAFRSQLPGAAEERRATSEPAPALSPPLPPPLPESPVPAPPAAETMSVPSATSATATIAPAPKAGTPVSRAASDRTTSAGDPTRASASSDAPKPAITAPAPGAAAAPEQPSTKPEGPFNAEAARTALASAVAQASACRKPGDPSGVAVVTITFSPSGRVTSATIGGPPFAGTPTGGCIAATLRRARVPAFEGDMVTVKKTVEIQ